jgi:Tol biopolymer transport system component
MFCRSSARLFTTFALVLPSVAPLAGCGTTHGLPAGAPVMRAATTTAARGVTHPVAPVNVGTGLVTHPGTFLTQLGASSPTFSPRGDRLAFTTPSQGVLLAGPEGQSPTQLKGSLPGDHEPAFSPLGDAVAVVRAGAAGGAALVRIELATGRATTVFQSQSAIRQPIWLPGAVGIIFVQDAGNSALMRLEMPSQKVTPVWQGPLAGSPTVTPDGHTVIFERRDNDGQIGLARLALPGNQVSALVVVGTHPRSPALSSTGRSLAYVADEGIFVALADGSQSKRIASGALYDAICWRPSLAELVVGATQGSRTDLERVDLPAR